MKVVSLAKVRDTIKDLVQKANFELQDDVVDVIKEMEKKEESPAGKRSLNKFLKTQRLPSVINWDSAKIQV